jgi:lipid II:glycine glycyltransferase (peptidoglycan interpeptide bridge formation enzyme)
MGYWSGLYGTFKPNELLDWEVIKWAKTQGYRYYDFEGIDFKVAKIIQEGNALPDSCQQTPTSYKLGFSQQVVLFPSAYEYVYHPVIRWIYNKLAPRLSKFEAVRKRVKRFRTQ